MPHEGYADPVTNDGPGFHSDTPISELTERVTRAIDASDISSTPLDAKTTDGVTITKMSRPSIGPSLRVGAQEKLDLQGDRTRGRRTTDPRRGWNQEIPFLTHQISRLYPRGVRSRQKRIDVPRTRHGRQKEG